MSRLFSLSSILLSLLLSGIFLSGCLSTRNTASSRHYKAFLTQYNTLYNGQEHYRTTVESILRAHSDDYSSLLPPDPLLVSPDPGAFDRSIEKASKAISLRSISRRPRRNPSRSSRDPEYSRWLTQSEFNPVIHNAWLLLGKAQLLNGDPSEAASTFLYIIDTFTHLPATVATAKIWRAKALAAAGDYLSAERILASVDPDKLPLDRPATFEYHLTLASIMLSTDRFSQAIPPLRLAVSVAPGSRRARLQYLLGQLLSATANRDEAYTIFNRLARSASASPQLRINARIRRSEVAPPANASKEIKSLSSLTRYGKNREIAPKINYAIGNLHLTAGDSAKAFDSYRLTLADPHLSTEHGLAALCLGRSALKNRDYSAAQSFYSIALSALPESYAGRDSISAPAGILDELVLHLREIDRCDSLLELSALPSVQQKEIARSLADRYIRRRDKLAADSSASSLSLPDYNDRHQIQSFSLSSSPADASWYFYNKALVEAGSREFRRRWGNRKLEDDWRRRDKNRFYFPSPDDDDTAVNPDENPPLSSDQQSLPASDDPATPEFYLRRIPSTPSEIATIRQGLLQALFSSGMILNDRLGDYPGARRQFNRLLSEFPDNLYRYQLYHSMLLSALRTRDSILTDSLATLIRNDFPASPLADAVSAHNFPNSLLDLNRDQERLYDRAFDMFLNAAPPRSIHNLVDSVRRLFPLGDLLPKFLFLDALAYTVEGDNDNFTAAIRTLVSRFPDADVSGPASIWLNRSNDGALIQPGQWHHFNPIAPTTRPSDDSDLFLLPDSSLSSLPSAGGDLPLDVAMVPHKLLITFPPDSINPNLLLFEIARFNFSTFTIRDFELEQHSDARQGLIIIRGFKSAHDIDAYIRRLPSGLIPPAARLTPRPD